ncbi:MAG: DNA polymerase III subunit alpha [Bacilli bacterium]|nr:DNA polymerase III subunit alpha [Bacilli bacterium]
MYIPLCVKTDYSLLSSLIKIEDLIAKVKEYGFTGVGIVDDNLSYVMEFYNIAIKNEIKPIIGLEVVLDNKKIYLYAKSYIGYQNLCYISSNEKTIDNIKNNSIDLLCIIPYESISLYDELNIPDTFVGYGNKDEIDDKYKNIFINEARCFKEEDNEYLRYLTLIKEGKTIDDKIEDYKNSVLLDKVDINVKEKEYFEEIYNLCNVKIEKQDLLPKYSDDKEFNENEYLEKLSKKGLLKRFNNKVPIKYAKRLEKELDIIKNMGFSNYFLVVWDYVKFAKKNGILVGPGRGSAAGSLVSYSLGITDIDPIKYDLYFERFLNPERVTMPDIDIDFESTRRDEVVDYVTSKYGSKRVCEIITYGTLKAKMVLRDIARVFNMDNKIDSFIKMFDSNLSLEDNLKNNNIKEVVKKDTLLSRICKISLKLEGLKRLTSVHAAGVVISNKELDRYIPIYKNGENYLSGYTMNYIESLGLLKMDFLALDNLVLVSNLLNEIDGLDIKNIPLDDKKTLDIFRNVKTDGIFQFESSGMKNVLRKFPLKDFRDLSVILALFRPGPMDSIDTYIKRMNGKEKIDYIHEDLKPVLEETYGIIVYQEQIMRIANIMAGFSLGEADVLRRAMSKKSEKLMQEQKVKFIDGALSKGYKEDIANKTFDYIYKFASYGFNKAHSVSYSLISYQMAYLKAHYSNHYMKYLLSMVIGREEKTKEYINECKLNKIKILKPDINISTDTYLIEHEDIRFPLTCIKNVGQVACKTIIEERKKKKFVDFLDFIGRTYNKGINRKILEQLIYSGAFDSISSNKKTLINNLDISINYAELINDLDPSFVEKPEFVDYEEFTKEELTNIEFNTFGFYLSNHPVQKYRQNNITTQNIKQYFNRVITIYLLVDRKNEIATKKKDKMVFITASDEFSSIELVVFPKVYERFYNISRGEVYKFIAKVEKRGSEYQLIVNNIEKL